MPLYHVPIVCALSDAAGIMGGYIVAVYMETHTAHVFTDSIKNLLLQLTLL